MNARSRAILSLGTVLSAAALLFYFLPASSKDEAGSEGSGGSAVPRADDPGGAMSVEIPSLDGDVVVSKRELQTPSGTETSTTAATMDEVEAPEEADQAKAVVDFVDNFEEIERWHSQLMDRSAPLEDKIAALDMLRFHKLEGGLDARTEEDFQEALWMLEIAVLDKERLGVLRAMKGLRQPELLDRLLDLLKYDPSPRVRAESAEVLGDFANNERALAALRKARTDDPHERVREKCKEILM